MGMGMDMCLRLTKVHTNTKNAKLIQNTQIKDKLPSMMLHYRVHRWCRLVHEWHIGATQGVHQIIHSVPPPFLMKYDRNGRRSGTIFPPQNHHHSATGMPNEGKISDY